MFIKTNAILGLVAATGVLTVSLPAIIVSHVKTVKEKEEKEEDYELSHECTRDSLMVAGVTGMLLGASIRAIVDGIKVLKH